MKKRKLLSMFIVLILLSLAVFSPVSVQASNPGNTLWGVIRFDGWSCDGNSYSSYEVPLLNPNKFHGRIPFYASEGDNTCSFPQISQSIEDQEIAYAANAGINYFAYCYYSPATNNWAHTERALDYHLSSSHKNDVQFCLIICDTGFSDQDLSTIVSYFNNSAYQRVSSSRPLLYIFGIDSGTEASYASSIRTKCSQQGIPNPYIVNMDSPSVASAIGADAVSRYTHAGSDGQPYASFASDEINQDWNSDLNSGMDVIPQVSTGWDPRPRIEAPGGYQNGNASYPSNYYATLGTPSEVAQHFQEGLNFASAHPTAANTVIMYSWNEFTEGSTICPKLSDQGSSLMLDTLSLVKKGGSTTPGYYNIQNKKSGQYLHATVDDYNWWTGVWNYGAPSKNFCMSVYPWADEEKFKLIDCGDGYYNIQNKKSGQYLHATVDDYNWWTGVWNYGAPSKNSCMANYPTADEEKFKLIRTN